MIMLADKPLTKEQFGIRSERMWLFCLYMYKIGSESFGNATDSARLAKYTGNENTMKQTGFKLVTNGNVQRAKAAIMLDTAEKIDHNRNIAIDLLRCDLTCLETKAMTGDTVAINARTGIVRELNAISNLHSSTVFDGTEPKRESTPAERAAALVAAKAYTDALVKSNTKSINSKVLGEDNEV